MPFPEFSRVIYDKNPLRQVICQLRFPPILRIDAEIPARFQEEIRKDFPNFGETSEIALSLPEGIEFPSEILKRAMHSSETKNYEFSSEDGIWKVNLTRTFISISTSKYIRWEHFHARLLEPLRVLIAEYKPPYFSRVGLRYIDVIKRSNLGLDNVAWTQLLQPHMLGVMSSPDVGQNVKQLEGRYAIDLDDGKGVVRMITKLAADPLDGEDCFVIDSDFFNTKKTETDDALIHLDFFHTRASRLIQWAITPQLHEAMEPTRI